MRDSHEHGTRAPSPRFFSGERVGVRGAACSERVERAPHPNPLPASRGEGAQPPCRVLSQARS
jgi:hypothetical protein